MNNMDPQLLVTLMTLMSVMLSAFGIFIGYSLGKSRRCETTLTRTYMMKMSNKLIQSAISCDNEQQAEAFRIEANIYRLWADKL